MYYSIYYCKQGSLSVVDLSGGISNVFKEGEFSVLNSEMCHHLEGLCNAYFPNDQCVVMQSHRQVRSAFKVYVRWCTGF